MGVSSEGVPRAGSVRRAESVRPAGSVRRTESVRPAGSGPRAAAVVLAVVLAAAAGACTRSSPSSSGRPLRSGLVTQATPAPGATVVVEVFGTQGLRFGGAYGELHEVKRVEGTVPMRLTFESREGFAVTLQKRGTDGELGIQVSVNGRRIKRASTTRAFGTVAYRQGPR